MHRDERTLERRLNDSRLLRAWGDHDYWDAPFARHDRQVGKQAAPLSNDSRNLIEVGDKLRLELTSVKNRRAGFTYSC